MHRTVSSKNKLSLLRKDQKNSLNVPKVFDVLWSVLTSKHCVQYPSDKSPRLQRSLKMLGGFLFLPVCRTWRATSNISFFQILADSQMECNNKLQELRKQLCFCFCFCFFHFHYRCLPSGVLGLHGAWLNPFWRGVPRESGDCLCIITAVNSCWVWFGLVRFCIAHYWLRDGT